MYGVSSLFFVSEFSQTMKYYLIVGEASGDLHASRLMNSLKLQDAEAEFRFFGGDLMAAVGGTCVKHYKDMAYMGYCSVAARCGYPC